MQAPPTESLPAPSNCDWCLYPLILCPYHPSEFVPYGEPRADPFLFYNQVVDGIISAESFQQIVELVPYREPGPPVIDSVDADKGESSTAETFRPIVASAEHVAASNRRRTTGSGRFTCDLCPENFTSKHNLQNHQNSHYGRKNHQCMPEGCGSDFATQSSLVRHRKTCKKR